MDVNELLEQLRERKRAQRRAEFAGGLPVGHVDDLGRRLVAYQPIRMEVTTKEDAQPRFEIVGYEAIWEYPAFPPIDA